MRVGRSDVTCSSIASEPVVTACSCPRASAARDVQPRLGRHALADQSLSLVPRLRCAPVCEGPCQPLRARWARRDGGSDRRRRSCRRNRHAQRTARLVRRNGCIRGLTHQARRCGPARRAAGPRPSKTCVALARPKLNCAVTQLDKLHAKHILPGFADRTAEEQTIERLTREITQVRRRDEVPG